MEIPSISNRFRLASCVAFVLGTLFLVNTPALTYETNLHFNVYYLGMRVGSLTIRSFDSTSTSGRQLRVVHLQSRTARFAGAFFRVEDSYTVVYDPHRLALLQIRKSIRQSNVSHKLTIAYTDRKAVLENHPTRQWPVSDKVLDVVSLMDLLLQLVASDTTFTVPLDQEAAPMLAWIRVYSSREGRFATAIVRRNGRKIRRWKTDLLTNRFSKEGARLELRFRPHQYVPYELRYSLGPAMATARLVER